MSISDSLKNLQGNLLFGKKDDAMIDQRIPSSAVRPSEVPGAESHQNQRIAADTDRIFSDAVAMGASDIHIEPTETGVKIRMRVDGHFTEYANLPYEERSSLVARLKILASLKIDEQRLPQDGKASYRDAARGRDVDLRVSTIPTIYGEKIVIRLLRKESELMDLRSI